MVGPDFNISPMEADTSYSITKMVHIFFPLLVNHFMIRSGQYQHGCCVILSESLRLISARGKIYVVFMRILLNRNQNENKLAKGN